MLFRRKTGIVNVKMIITEEKILSNIEKVSKLINPKSKKQIVQLEDDSYFRDLVDSIKSYLIEYPKKKNFPLSVYNAAHGLIEYATTEFEENTKKIESLIRQRETNIETASKIKKVLNSVENREKDWKNSLKESKSILTDDLKEAFTILIKTKVKERGSDTYKEAVKTISTKISNLESNLHIQIDIERIEDRSKALSFIGLEIAQALKEIPVPEQSLVEMEKVEVKTLEEVVEPANSVNLIEENKEKKANKAQQGNIIEEIAKQRNTVSEIVENNSNAEQDIMQQEQFIEETRVEVKPSLWERVKNMKLIRGIRYIFKIKIVLELPALPEGRGENE